MTIKEGLLKILISQLENNIIKAHNIGAPSLIIKDLNNRLSRYKQGKINISKRANTILDDTLTSLHFGVTNRGRSFILVNMKYEFTYNNYYHSWFIDDGTKLTKYKLDRII